MFKQKQSQHVSRIQSTLHTVICLLNDNNCKKFLERDDDDDDGFSDGGGVTFWLTVVVVCFGALVVLVLCLCLVLVMVNYVHENSSPISHSHHWWAALSLPTNRINCCSQERPKAGVALLAMPRVSAGICLFLTRSNVKSLIYEGLLQVHRNCKHFA